MRVFLDANVLFSAAKSDGAVRELLDRLRAAGYELCADAYVVAEARRNLELKAAAATESLDAMLSNVDVATFEPATLPAGLAVGLPDKDRPALAAAIRRRCDGLVTGDRTPFGAFYGTSLGGVRIHSPRSVAEALLD